VAPLAKSKDSAPQPATPASRVRPAADRGTREAFPAGLEQGSAPPELGLAQVLALQRFAGNAAVSGLFGRPPPAVQRQGPGTAVATPPKVKSWSSHIVKGGEGAGLERTYDATGGQKVFKGDRMTVSAEFGTLTDDQRKGVQSIDAHAGDSSVCAVTGGDWQGNKLTWEVTFLKVGPLKNDFNVFWEQSGAQLEFGTYSESSVVVADLADFIMAVQVAQSQILSRFSSATAQLNQAAQAFRQAQADQDAALHEVSSEEKMIDDLLYGALFAGLGGAAGGAVGGALKNTFMGWSAAEAGAATDAAKDLTKFAVRSMDKMRGSGGGGPSTSGDSTAPASPTAPAGGERKASGENPLDFLTTQAALVAGDQAKVQDSMTKLVEAARQARDANSKTDFDEDPMEVASRKSELDDITGKLNTDKKYYLKELWHSWLGAYGYKLTESVGKGGRHASVDENVGRKVRKAIRKAAEQCGEDGDTWIQQFSDPLRVKLEAEAAATNAHPLGI
jgi:hypothetical protein